MLRTIRELPADTNPRMSVHKGVGRPNARWRVGKSFQILCIRLQSAYVANENAVCID